jgi:hypothetical protein
VSHHIASPGQAQAQAAADGLLSGAVSTEATKQHFWITHRLLDVGLRLSVAESSQDVQAPALDSRALIDAQSARDFPPAGCTT